MRKNSLLVSAGVALVLAAATSTSVMAWSPKGVIVKQVQNQTTKGALQDANSANAAVIAKEGDVLKYVITVRNDGQPNEKGWNDMAGTVMTDTLPAGVELVNSPAQRTITENIGVIKPQDKKVFEYTVKVTSKDGGAVIENKACFTGDSGINDNPQKGCDVADIKVTVPVKPIDDKKPEKPEQPEKPEEKKPVKPEEKPVEKPAEKPEDKPAAAPAVEIPSTGPEQLLSGFAGASALAYAATSYIRSRR